jgi:hypothetical protein
VPVSAPPVTPPPFAYPHTLSLSVSCPRASTRITTCHLKLSSSSAYGASSDYRSARHVVAQAVSLNCRAPLTFTFLSWLPSPAPRRSFLLCGSLLGAFRLLTSSQQSRRKPTLTFKIPPSPLSSLSLTSPPPLLTKTKKISTAIAPLPSIAPSQLS